jgi:hypothetical protein
MDCHATCRLVNTRHILPGPSADPRRQIAAHHLTLPAPGRRVVPDLGSIESSTRTRWPSTAGLNQMGADETGAPEPWRGRFLRGGAGASGGRPKAAPSLAWSASIFRSRY